mmetsp:Transcript_41024/g.95366  ORF Transcript_41024/g.95366 Transcript_41024/m.95366 type:complete len:247 (-) Transcript_41024:1077-1817(-)
MADTQHSSSKVFDCRLQRSQRLNIQIVGRLIQHETITTQAQRLGELKAVALPAAQRRDGALLDAAAEVEPGAVGPTVHRPAANVYGIEPVGELFKNGRVAVKLGAHLFHVHRSHRLPHQQLPTVWLLLTHDHLKERGLPRSVRADDAHYGSSRDLEVGFADEKPLAVSFRQVLRGDHRYAGIKPRARSDDDRVQLTASIESLGLGFELFEFALARSAFFLPAATASIDEFKLLCHLRFKRSFPLRF